MVVAVHKTLARPGWTSTMRSNTPQRLAGLLFGEVATPLWRPTNHGEELHSRISSRGRILGSTPGGWRADGDQRAEGVGVEAVGVCPW